MNWRDLQTRMRRDVHRQMAVPASLYRGADAPVTVHIQIQNTKPTQHGDLVGTSFNYAVAQDSNPTIVSRVEEYSPRRGDILSVAVGEAYHIDNTLPVDVDEATAEVIVMTAAQAASYPPPEEEYCL